MTTYQDVLDLINNIVVQNGNNEITADVLRPVLQEMLEQPNELVGVLNDLDTSDTTSIVNAINSILSQNIPAKTRLYPIDTTGVDFSQDELVWVAEAIDNTAANNGIFTCNAGEQMVFYCDILINSDNNGQQIRRQFYRHLSGVTEVAFIGGNPSDYLMPDGSTNIDLDNTSNLIIDLGNIGIDDIEDAFNSDAAQPFTIDGDTFIQAVQNGDNKLWQWIGGNGTFGNSATLALSSFFVDLTSSTTPPSNDPKLEYLVGSSIYKNLTGQTSITLDLNSFYFEYINTDDDLEINFSNTPNENYGFHRRLEVVLPSTKTLTIPSADIIGEYTADGSFVNQIDLYFKNYPTEGLRVIAIINNGVTSSGVPDGDKGDITVSSNGTVWEIDDDTIDTDKLQDDAVTADKLADSLLTKHHEFACSDETSDLETGTVYEQVLLRDLNDCTSFDFGVIIAPTGSTIIIDVQKNGTTVFDTKPTIDAGEFTTLTASTPQVITGGSVSFSTGDVIKVVIDQVGSTVAGVNLKAQITYK